MASQVKGAAWLEWIAGLMGTGPRRQHAANLPPGQFHCLLDALPLHLVPRRAFDPLNLRYSGAEPLVLDPDCLILPADQLPEGLQFGATLDGFCRQGTIAWVLHAESGAQRPFWLGPAFESFVAELKPGKPASASLPAYAKRLLARAGILASAKVALPATPGHNLISASQAQAFREKNYTPVSGLIHPFHLAALRRYYRHQIRTGAIWLGDEQSSRRYAAHNEPVARFFHHQITNTVSAIVGEPVKPSYVYLASYLPGAELKKHTDRDQCEFSVTLCLDFSPEPELATSWPICVETAEGTVSVYQGLGDGLVYRGTKVPHFRSVLKEGYTSTSIFFHYVAADFAGSLD